MKSIKFSLGDDVRRFVTRQRLLLCADRKDIDSKGHMLLFVFGLAWRWLQLQDPKGPEPAKSLGELPLVTDAQELYVAVPHATSANGMKEKRAGLKITIIRERLEIIQGRWAWVNMLQEVADGRTRVSTRLRAR